MNEWLGCLLKTQGLHSLGSSPALPPSGCVILVMTSLGLGIPTCKMDIDTMLPMPSTQGGFKGLIDEQS